MLTKDLLRLLIFLKIPAEWCRYYYLIILSQVFRIQRFAE